MTIFALRQKTKYMRDMLSTNMKVSDILDIDYSLLQIIPRFGMDLKHAGLTVAEACRECGIDPDTFILICNVYSCPDHTPSPTELASGKVNDIVKYLRNSHDYYTGQALLELGRSFDKLIASCAENQKKVIVKFFADYKTELEKHFAYEEQVVFPYIGSLLETGRGDSEYSIEQFEEHHENVEEKLQDLKNIVMKYLPGEIDESLRIEVLQAIYSLQDDLRRHTYVEDNILVPIVSRLERDGA